MTVLVPFTVQADSLLPERAKAKGNYNETTKCVEKVDVMRKDHMSFILHQRNDTLRKGVRTKQHSLKECINCHNAPASDGTVASIKDKEHFCTTCHTYTAVQIDCFKCHSDKPENTKYKHSLSDQSPKQHELAKQDTKPEAPKAQATVKEGQQ